MFIELIDISKKFPRPEKSQEPVWAAKNVSLGVEKGKMLALVGPSGSGKTTLLRCIAGLETPDSGAIRIAGRDVFSASPEINVPTEKRNLGLIFQSYALWPNMSVQANVAYPLARRRVPPDERRQRVRRYLELVGCAELADRYPHELSGGQQQRIALARALVYEPSVVLFDEPLSNLDPTLREHLRSQIREIQRNISFTGVYITHDQEEAFFIGDHVALLSHGEVIQFGRPIDIYTAPSTARVAGFVGATNTIRGRISEDGRCFLSREIGSVELSQRHQATLSPGLAVKLLIRPSLVRLRADGSHARLRDRVIMGGCEEFSLEFEGGTIWRVRSEIVAGQGASPGDMVAVELDPEGIMIFRDDEA